MHMHIFVFDIQRQITASIAFCSSFPFFRSFILPGIFPITNSNCTAANMRRTITKVIYVQYLPKCVWTPHAFPLQMEKWHGTKWHFWWSAMPTILFYSYLMHIASHIPLLRDFTCVTLTHRKDPSASTHDAVNNGDDFDHRMWIANTFKNKTVKNKCKQTGEFKRYFGVSSSFSLSLSSSHSCKVQTNTGTCRSNQKQNKTKQQRIKCICFA